MERTQPSVEWRGIRFRSATVAFFFHLGMVFVKKRSSAALVMAPIIGRWKFFQNCREDAPSNSFLSERTMTILIPSA
ncbi:hypothetical protein D3870_04320 [Noviherbaspirillum cavernae]|uniref:Uncharacterized protein n=1 Tax=Noviherbaspirillum cavernae TaxID=2320862 RepID=A0A418WYP6_9BURK|nr:hypothetical protein D3870_04320 [Noviherbaspirillum cavernae]